MRTAKYTSTKREGFGPFPCPCGQGQRINTEGVVKSFCANHPMIAGALVHLGVMLSLAALIGVGTPIS